VEEPEVGLHLAAQRRVASALAKLPTFGVQTIVVTHSPTIIDAASPSGLRVMSVRELDDGSRAREVLVPDGLGDIAGAGGALPSDILLGDRFLIVEGESDAAILRVWAQRRGWDLDRSHVRVYAAGGWARAHGLASFVSVAYEGARFFVLLDNGQDTPAAAD